MSDLHERVAAVLRENGSPVKAEMLKRCKSLIEHSRYWTTVHLYCPDAYTCEQLGSGGVWPLVHQTMVSILGCDLTLNLTKTVDK